MTICVCVYLFRQIISRDPVFFFLLSATFQFLAHVRLWINICWMNDWMIESVSESFNTLSGHTTWSKKQLLLKSNHHCTKYLLNGKKNNFLISDNSRLTTADSTYHQENIHSLARLNISVVSFEKNHRNIW